MVLGCAALGLSLFDLVSAAPSVWLQVVVGVGIAMLAGVFRVRVPRLNRNERLQWSDLFGLFGWVSVAYASSATVAVLLYPTYLQSGIGVLMAMVPLLGMMLATQHFFFRQQEADEAVRQAGAAALVHPDRAFAVMFLDFDRFKLINDSLGHTAGDEFLIQVSRRISESLHPRDIVARLGGDEFAVLVRQMAHESDAVGLANRLVEAPRKPYHVAATELMTSARIGITFSALGYTSPEDVLRDAIDDGRLTLAYQPVCELGGSARVRGFEALVRLQHTHDSAIGPTEFLPIAEEAGLMLKLTDDVMHTACRQLREWQLSDPAHADLTMNVNVSGPGIAHPAFVARVARMTRVTRAIVEAGLQPRHLYRG